MKHHARLALVVCLSLAVLPPALAAGVAWPLRLSADGRRLLDENGVPFLMIGAAPWSMVVNLTPADMDRYLNDRAAKGFNTIILRGIDAHVPWGGPDDYRGAAPFTNGTYDWTVRNENYWQTLDLVIAKAAARDMLVLLAPAYLGYQCGDEGWCAQMQAQSDAVMYDYGRFIGDRYKGRPNIIWIDGGDCDGSQFGLALDRVIAVKDGIVSVDRGVLRGAHTGRNDVAALDYPWIDLHPAYSECYESSLRIYDEYTRTPARPVFLIEARYENEGASLTCLASQALWSFLGGAVGHVFGNRPEWLFDAGWDGPQGIGSPGSVQMGHLGQLMRSRAWWLLQPDYAHAVVTSGYGTLGTSDYVPAARTSDGNTVMVHLPVAGAAVTVDMTRVAGSLATGWWYDPASGMSTTAGTFATTGTRTFTAPRSNSVLVLDSKSANLASPGTTVYPPPTPLATAGNLRLRPAAAGAAEVTFRWSPVPGASAYRVYSSPYATGPFNDARDAGKHCFDTNGDLIDDTCDFTSAVPADRSVYFLVTGYAGASESPLH